MVRLIILAVVIIGVIILLAVLLSRIMTRQLRQRVNELLAEKYELQTQLWRTDDTIDEIQAAIANIPQENDLANVGRVVLDTIQINRHRREQ